MNKLNFEITVNSSDFIAKTEQIRAAIRATALEMDEQEQKISSSFMQMADNVCLATGVTENALKEMQRQINETVASLFKLDAENEMRLERLKEDIGASANVKVTEISSKPKDLAYNEVATREKFSAEIDNQYKELEQLSIALESYQKSLEKAKSELSDLRSELVQVSEEMDKMHCAGQQNTEVYGELESKTINLADSIKLINNQFSNILISTQTLEGVKSGLEGVSGALTTVSSMMDVFSVENKTLKLVMDKVQSAIAMTNGLLEVNNMLNKESAFQINIVGRLKLWWRTITLQAASAQGVETVAASAGTVVNLGLAGSFRAIGLAIKSIPVFGWILAGISTLIGLYSLWSSSTEEQQEKQSELNKSVKEFNDSVQNNASKPIAMIELLSIKFKALGNDVEAQKKFIEDNKKVFDDLGVSIGNVKDAQQLLIDNKDKFVEAQMAKAISLAYIDKMQEEAKKYVDAQTAANTWKKVGEMKDKEETVVVNGFTMNKGKRPMGKEERELLKSQGMLREDGNILRYDEVLEKQYSKDADKSKKMMSHFGKLAFGASKKSDDAMAGFPKGSGKTNSGQENNTEQIEEAHKKVMELLDKQKEEEAFFVKDAADKRAQADIDAKAEGMEKVLAQMGLDHKKELEAVENEKNEMLRKRRETAKALFDAQEVEAKARDDKHIIKAFDPATVKLDLIEEDGFKERTDFANQKYTNRKDTYFASQMQSMSEYLKQYDTLIEKRKAIIALGEKRKEGKSEEEQKNIDIETKNALSDFDIEVNKDKSAFGKLFSDIKENSVQNMRIIVEEAQKTLDFIQGGEWDAEKGEEFHISKESFEVLGGSAEEIVKIKNGIKEMTEQADASDVALNKMAIGFEHLFSAGSDPEKLKKALGEIENAMNEIMQSTQFLSDCLSGLGDAFGNNTLSGIAEGMNVAMDAANSAMSGAKAGAMFGPWGAAAGAAIGLVSSLGASLAKLHDKKNEKNIQRIQEQIEVLEKSYENLGDSLDKAFSQDASNLIDQQNTLLEQQKVLIANQISEERGKKNADEGRIKEWENQINDIDKVIAGNKEKKIDVIFGEDLKAAINNFAQAYADAWSAGDDKAKSSKDLVKNMIKQMIMEAIKAASSKPMEELRKKLAGYFSDGIISDWERGQIEKDAEKIMNDLDRQFGWADEYMKGDEEEKASSQNSTKGGFTSMSQETGDELNGRFTALQISNEEIKNSMFFMLGNLSSLCTTSSNNNFLLIEMRNLAVMSNSHLEDIAKHTKVLLGFGEKLDNIDYNTKSLTTK